jgi:hypothetical protein
MKKIARLIGALFLVATGSFMIGTGLLDPVLHQPDFLAGLYPDRTNVVVGLFLEFINAVAVVGIAMLLYPILKKHNEALALGYFGSRIIESTYKFNRSTCTHRAEQRLHCGRSYR